MAIVMVHTGRGTTRRFVAAAAFAAMAFLGCPVARAQDPGDAWSWQLPPRRFGRLSQIERAQLERAESLFKANNFAAAAIEYEKFGLQFPDSDGRVHALLLQAYSLQQARTRNAAIDLYTRLLDVHANAVDEAAPAMFLMGNAHIQNGDVERGIAALTELADHTRYQEHPIVDVAINQVAAHHARLEDDRTAERYWRRVLDLHADAFMRPEKAAAEARTRLADLYVRTQRYPALESALVRGEKDPAKRRDIARFVYDRAMGMIGNLDARAGAAFLAWFRSQRDFFQRDRDLDDYLQRTLRFAIRLNDRAVFTALRADFSETGNIGVYLNEALGFLGRLKDRRAVNEALQDAWNHADGLSGRAFENTTGWLAGRMAELTEAELIDARAWERFQQTVLGKDEERPAAERLRIYRAVLPRLGKVLDNMGARVLWDTLMARAVARYREQMYEERNSGLAGLVDIASAAEQFERALDLTESMDNRPLAVWKSVEVHQRQQNWAAAAEACEQLEKMDNTDLAMRALRTRAALYKDRLARYEEAIRLYNQINDPPATAWAVADCYVRWQRPADADRVLTEIENFFEREAPNAAWRKVQIWEQFKNRQRMIAAARAVLRRYPEHRISSQAHQLLNRYGVDLVGGGLMEEED